MTRRAARVTAFSSQPRVRRRAEATQPGLSLARGSHVGAARSANGCTLGGMRRQITGGCGCGAVRFEVVEPFLSAGYCHCTRCQRRTGTASSANARAVPGSVLVVQGEDELRGWTPEGGREKIFCARCGSALFSCEPGSGIYTGVRLGAIDGDPGIRPRSRAFVAYAAPWEAIPDDGLPRFDEARPGYDEGR